MEKALIAMSGGVDSSVAAYLTKEKGYISSGITMKMFDTANPDEPKDAAAVCARLGMDHILLDACDVFRTHVIDTFVSEYQQGKTPNPCVVCNKHIKFGHLLAYAIDLGYDYIVTGHYAQIEKSGDRYLLKKAKDIQKDQTYFLYSLTQHDLAHTLFPLGSLTKDSVRAIAEEHNFVTARKRDSQDICFAPNGHVEFIERFTGVQPQKGNFIDTAGNIIGEHNGILKYTIGQRKGLGMAFGKPVYVCRIDPENNTVMLGDEKEIFSRTLTAKNINMIAYDKLNSPIRVTAKIRYAQTAEPATVVQTDDDEIKVMFDNNIRAITSGQSVVLYDEDTVIGGGTVIGE